MTACSGHILSYFIYHFQYGKYKTDVILLLQYFYLNIDYLSMFALIVTRFIEEMYIAPVKCLATPTYS